MDNFEDNSNQNQSRFSRHRDSAFNGLVVGFGWLGRGVTQIVAVVVGDMRYLRTRFFKEVDQMRERGQLTPSGISRLCLNQLDGLRPAVWKPRFKQWREQTKARSSKQWEEFKVDMIQIRDRVRDIRTPAPEHQQLGLLSPFSDERRTILAASILINLLALAFPLLMLQMYDRILPRQSMETLLLFAIGVGVAFGLEAITRIVRSYITAWISARFEQRAMVALAERVLAEPLHEFERKGTGSVLEEFKSISTLKHHYSGQTFQQLMDLPFTLLYVLIVFFISPWIGLLLAAGYAVFVYVTWKHGREAPMLIKDQKEGDLRRGNFLNEILTNIHTLKSMTMEALMLRRYERLQESCARLMQRMTYALDMSAGLGNVFSPLMNVLVVALGAWLVITHHLTNGELAACILLGLRSLAPLQRLGGMWAKYQQDEVLRDKLASALQRRPLPVNLHPEAESTSPAKNHFVPASIELQDVSYRFPGTQHDVLRQLNLQVGAGECVAIDGFSGCGRSTLLQVLAGILQPDHGRVLVNGTDLRDIDLDQLTSQVAYLPQKTQMFEGSLLDNVSMFTPERVERSLEAARSLGLGDFVTKMPRGWDSPVGDQAADSLPPGYRQRIAIVRALSNLPSVILFDDATSAIDAEGDAVLLRFLEAIKGKVTMIMVCQRPSFLRLANRTLYMQDGQLRPVEEGRVVSALQAVQTANIPAAQGAKTATMSVPFNAIPPGQYFESPTKRGEEQPDRWKHMHETVSGNFKHETDLSGCLTLLLRLTNVRGSAREVAESLPYFTDKLDLTGLQNTMSQLGYQMREVDCRLGELDKRALPCLFIPDDGPAMVVMGRIGNQVRIGFDTAHEPVLEPDLDIQGRAFFFEAATFAVPEGRSWVRVVVGRFAPLISQATISALISGLVMMAGPLFLMIVYSTVIPTGSGVTLFYLSLGAVIAVASGYYFMQHRASILAFIAGRIEYLFGTAILQQVLRMQPSYTERASVGSQTARLQTFESIRNLFTGPLAATMLESPATLVLLVALSIINPIALLVFFVMAGIYAFLYWMFNSRSRERVSAVNRATTRRTEFLTEMVGKMRVVRECSAQRIWLDRFRDVAADASMASFEAEKLSSLLVGLSYFVMMFAALMIVSFTAPFVMDQRFGAGVLIASMLLMWRVLSPVQTIFVNMTRIELIQSATRQIDALMRIQGERPEISSVPSQRNLQGAIDFQRVSFRYSMHTDPALVGVEFRIKPGEMIAVSGPNGGGKSTLLKLMLGMYQPQAGSILIDNVDIRQIDPLELRRLIGYAPQDAQLFRATIAQNLRFSRPDATDDEVYQALDMAGALDQILALPKGLEYRVGDNTNELSGSLKQKILLARAYLTRAPIMIFDEPGTGLDAEGDQKFIEALKSLKGKATVVFISHRPSHIRIADTLLVFDKGYLRAAGAPDDLLRQPSAA